MDSIIMPTNIEAEAAVLGSMLSTAEVLHHLPFLKAEHFHEPVHQRIFDAIRATAGRGMVATPVSLKEQFEKDDHLKDIGGFGYLTKLTSLAFRHGNPVEHARLVISLAKRRELIQGCIETAKAAAESPDLTPEELANDLARLADSVSSEIDAQKTRDSKQVGEAIIDRLKSRVIPTSTGMSKLDRAMGGGLYPGRSYGFAARMKVGKTVLASTLSHNLNLAGVKHLFVCGEMGDEEIHERCLARQTDSDPSDFRGDGSDSPHFLGKIADYVVRDNRCAIYQNAPGLTFDALKRYVASALYRRKIQGVILDYWQLVGGKPKGKSTAEHLDEVAQWIADYCRQHGIWSITMAQINQEGNTRGGEGIKLAFDQVYELIREDDSMPEAWLKMLNTRYTPWLSIGSKTSPGLFMNPKGPFFEQTPEVRYL